MSIEAKRCNVELYAQPPLPFATVFARGFVQLDDLYRSFDRDGVLVVGISDEGDIRSYLHVPVDVEPVFAVVGRHHQCDLVVGADPRVSSRHAMLGARRIGLGEVRIRLWDLDTRLGIATEAGGTCEGLVAEGPLFLRIGQYPVFCLPTGALAPLPWGRTAAETWSSFPERVLRDLRRPTRRAAPVEPGNEGQAGPVTRMIPGPAALGSRTRGWATSLDDAGQLRIATGDQAIERAVSFDELKRGLIVGRYDRCALTARLDAISRVHLLLIEDEGAVWAVDTASTNGTTLHGARVRQFRLADETILRLGDRVELRWSAAPGRPRAR